MADSVCLAAEVAGGSRAVRRPAARLLLGLPRSLSLARAAFTVRPSGLRCHWTAAGHLFLSTRRTRRADVYTGSDPAGIGAGSRRGSMGAGPCLLFPRSPQPQALPSPIKMSDKVKGLSPIAGIEEKMRQNGRKSPIKKGRILHP